MTEKEAITLLLGKTDEERYGPRIMEALRTRRYKLARGRTEVHGGMNELIMIFYLKDKEIESSN